MTRVLVTGASGFVGRTLCDMLAHAGYQVRAALRGNRPVSASVSEVVRIDDIVATTDWSDALCDVDLVIHAAARVHVLHDTADNLDLYMQTNALGTLRLANESAQAGVRRFIFLSSVKVNGEGGSNRAYTASDEACPQDNYGRSKWLGEQHLHEVAARTGMQAVVVRSPLVYGPGVRANFFRLMQWVDKERPLPLGSVNNRRSLISIWNLCDFLLHVLKNPYALGGTWMVSDGEDLSTPDLIRRLAGAMGRHARLLPVPVSLLRALGTVAGRGEEIARLCGSLVLDIAPTRNLLAWAPPIKMDEGIVRTVAWYRSTGESRAT